MNNNKGKYYEIYKQSKCKSKQPEKEGKMIFNWKVRKPE